MEPNLDLYLVTDEPACLGRDLLEVVEEAVRGGATLVQLREKTLDTRAFVERATRLKELLRPYGVPLLINDRLDVALAVDADGVHIGQSDMPYARVRQLLPPGKLIGLSVETPEQVLEAEPWDLTYLAVSPLYATPSKTDHATPWGLEGLRWVRQHSRHRLVVIGGLNAATIPEAIAHGADGVAVISAICSAPSPGEAAQVLYQQITHSLAQRT
ncbi:thiamine phosphate synthase [Rhabdobacter roseus]|uniref:Thiamine-phosphate synthase n=1 Tax=Rhabdobacter roseus TaxID=1655419 RepID=A0A840TZD5_9BACT|nr:thiamine phosphate synthase [Rhabdobacter roseus]MBB5285548.1 thiamine-phosphate pyrophosphorylase [Rhabdobacter roseus]